SAPATSRSTSCCGWASGPRSAASGPGAARAGSPRATSRPSAPSSRRSTPRATAYPVPGRAHPRPSRVGGMTDAAHTLILLRHGESDWNAKNLFTGWVDVDLTDKGRAEALRAGELMAAEQLLPDVVHTSLLRRAITTANSALDVADRHWIPVHRSWRLNERHYGALQGLDKAATREKYGEEQFMLWRRSFDTPPPPIEEGNEFSQAGDPRYA